MFHLFMSNNNPVSRDKKVFVNWFTLNRGRYITLEMAGNIFGGRYGESPQLLRNFDYSQHNELTIFFDTTETLVIVNPSNIKIGNNKELVIDKAEQISFNWHYYGRPKIPENRCSEVYILKDECLEYKTSGPVSNFPKDRTFQLNNNSMLKLYV